MFTAHGNLCAHAQLRFYAFVMCLAFVCFDLLLPSSDAEVGQVFYADCEQKLIQQTPDKLLNQEINLQASKNI